MKNERYNKLIEKLNNKLNKPMEKINQLGDKSISLETYKVIRSSLLAKYIKSAKAVAFLDMNGFFEDSKIILRTMYEIMIILLYCNINPKEYYNRFKNYKCVNIKKYIESLNDEQLKYVKKEALENNKKEYNEYKNKYIKNKKDEKYWNGKTFKETMAKVAKTYDQSIENLYYDVYMLNCEEVHSDFSGILNNYLILSNGNIEITADIKKNLDYINIVQSLEQISEKLNYINFDW